MADSPSSGGMGAVDHPTAPGQPATTVEGALAAALEWMRRTIDRHTDECSVLRIASEGGAETDLDSAFGDVMLAFHEAAIRAAGADPATTAEGALAAAVLPTYITREWLDDYHPLEYGTPGTIDHMLRCPTCEEWSPCRVRTLYEYAIRAAGATEPSDPAMAYKPTHVRGEPVIDLDDIEMRWASEWNESDDGQKRAWRDDIAALIDEVHRLRIVSNGYYDEMVRRTPGSRAAGATERERAIEDAARRALAYLPAGQLRDALRAALDQRGPR